MIERVDGRCAAGREHVEVDVAVAFVDGALAEGDRADVEARIDACATCRRVIAAAAAREAPTIPGAPTDIMEAPSVAELALAPGEQVGRYVVERALGAGGMGVVALARDSELRRAVVIKLVRPDLSDEGFEVRLLREAQAMALVSHPNVVQIFDIGRHRDRVFLAMEYVPGQTLDAWLVEKPRTRDEVIEMFREAGAGLAAAHRALLVHRDFKPSNVLVGNDGVPKVTDFGLARAVDTEPAASPWSRQPRASGVHAALTRADAVLGTPAYMSPEQGRGEPVDARTDQYAFALALLDALVDQRPNARRIQPGEPTRVESAGGTQREAPSIQGGLEAAGVPEAVRTALARALAQNPEERFAAIDELLTALAPARGRRRRWPIALAVALAAAGGAAAVWFALPSRAATEQVTCRSETAARWSSARATVKNTLETTPPRTFASWTAAQVVDALDASFARIADDEMRRCEAGQPAVVPTRCLADASVAGSQLAMYLDPALAPLAVRDLGCAAGSAREADIAKRLGELRDGLFRAGTAADYRALAARAEMADQEKDKQGRRAGFAVIAGDALEMAALLARGAGDFDGATRDYEALQAIGERTGLDGPRGRGHLGLLDLARHRGNYMAAVLSSRALAGMLERRGRAPADELAIALADGAAFTELGDVARAFAAWERAAALAKTPDDEVAAAAGLARARWWLRWDATGMVQVPPTASIHARIAAFLVDGELALARNDSARAARALEGARAAYTSVSPSADEDNKPEVFLMRALDARVRARLGEVDGAVESLGKGPAGSALAVRILAAKGRILADANRPTDAEQLLSEAWFLALPPFADRGRDTAPAALSHHERIELMLALCDAKAALGRTLHPCSGPSKLTAELHPDAPVLAKIALAQAGDAVPMRLFSQVHYGHERALAVLTAAKGPPGVIADLHWRLARDDRSKDRLAHGDAARALFVQLDKPELVDEIDAWKQRGSPPDPAEDPAP